MRVLMISCNITEEPYPVYPLGMTLVAEAARRRGHEVFEFDRHVQGLEPAALREEIRKVRPDVVGLSLRNVDSANFNKPDAYIEDYKRVVQTVRAETAAPVVLGGSAYTIFPEPLLRELGADHGIAGEGEDAFLRLLDQFETDPDSAYPIYYNNPTADDFSTPKRNTRLVEHYLRNGGMLNVQTKRGCPHQCAYCTYPILEGRRYRFRRPQDVVDEIEALTHDYGVDYYAITDSVFNDATGHYLQIAEELVRRGVDTPWMCFLRPDDFTPSEVELLVRSGLHAVEWGTDCATDATLAAMRKSFTWRQVVHSNNLFAKHGVANAHFIILGGPQETMSTLQQGLSNFQQLQKCVVFAGIGVRIFPGTEIYRIALQEGKIAATDALLTPVYYFSDQIDRELMHQTIIDAFRGRLDRIYPDGQHVETALALHRAGHRGPAWDVLLKRVVTR